MDLSGVAVGLSTGLSTFGAVSDIRSRGKAVVAAIDAEADSFMIQQNVLLEQENDLDRELGDVMSQNALKAMKAEARLRAGAAETGTSGGTTSQAVKEAYMVQTLDNAINISRKRASQTDLARRELMLRVGFKNRMQELQGSLMSPGAAAFSTFTSAVSGFNQGYSMTGDEFRIEMFGRDYNTLGKPNG